MYGISLYFIKKYLHVFFFFAFSGFICAYIKKFDAPLFDPERVPEVLNVQINEIYFFNSILSKNIVLNINKNMYYIYFLKYFIIFSINQPIILFLVNKGINKKFRSFERSEFQALPEPQLSGHFFLLTKSRNLVKVNDSIYAMKLANKGRTWQYRRDLRKRKRLRNWVGAFSILTGKRRVDKEFPKESCEPHVLEIKCIRLRKEKGCRGVCCCWVRAAGNECLVHYIVSQKKAFAFSLRFSF